MTTAGEELHDILYAGIGPDIHLAERARELHKAVGTAANAVNEAGFGELWQLKS
jgi:predicted HAD superfamily Cof-like phosphohydrolase